ncbi:unnamed protein product, partial [Pylaiella littoralis]
MVHGNGVFVVVAAAAASWPEKVHVNAFMSVSPSSLTAGRQGCGATITATNAAAVDGYVPLQQKQPSRVFGVNPIAMRLPRRGMGLWEGLGAAADSTGGDSNVNDNSSGDESNRSGADGNGSASGRQGAEEGEGAG